MLIHNAFPQDQGPTKVSQHFQTLLCSMFFSSQGPFWSSMQWVSAQQLSMVCEIGSLQLNPASHERNSARFGNVTLAPCKAISMDAHYSFFHLLCNAHWFDWRVISILLLWEPLRCLVWRLVPLWHWDLGDPCRIALVTRRVQLQRFSQLGQLD